MLVTNKVKNVLLLLLLLLPLSLGQPLLSIPQTALSTDQARKIELLLVDQIKPLIDQIRPLVEDWKIEPQLADQIRPLIEDWLIFYDIDINDFTCEPGHCDVEYGMQQFQPLKRDENSIYNREYSVAEDDIFDPVIFDYSPNKRYYVNFYQTAGVSKEKHGVYKFYGSDDCMEIYLYDRLRKRTDLMFWLGSAEVAEAVFWGKENNMVVVVGNHVYKKDGKDYFFIYANNIRFYFLDSKSQKSQSYFFKKLKEKGVKDFDGNELKE